MEIYWTFKAQDDLERIYRFALQYSRKHADDILDRIRQLVYIRLVMNPEKSEKCYLMTMRFTTKSVTMISISWISGIQKKNDKKVFFSYTSVD